LKSPLNEYQRFFVGVFVSLLCSLNPDPAGAFEGAAFLGFFASLLDRCCPLAM
jgi:hypothetical protein